MALLSWLAALDSDSLARCRTSTCRNQLITGFQLALFRSTNSNFRINRLRLRVFAVSKCLHRRETCSAPVGGRD